jgi:hypothetical protein
MCVRAGWWRLHESGYLAKNNAIYVSIRLSRERLFDLIERLFPTSFRATRATAPRPETRDRRVLTSSDHLWRCCKMSDIGR